MRTEAPIVGVYELAELLYQSWSAETSADPAGWSHENPSWGQCAVTALVAQDFLGGQIMRASLQDVTGYEHMRSHYWNKLPDGSRVDLSQQQFNRDAYAHIPDGQERARAVLIAHQATLERFARLRLAIENVLHPNSLLADPYLFELFKAAQHSDCKKLRFGAIVIKDGEIIARSANSILEPLRYLCADSCIREVILSRTNSMIGACGHAEEFAKAQVIARGIPLSECAMYICGFSSDNTPSFKNERDFSCIRCATQLFMEGMGSIYVPYKDHWERLTAQEAVEKSLPYAMRALGSNI